MNPTARLSLVIVPIALFALLGVFSLPRALAQEGGGNFEEMPVFRTLIGERKESGVVRIEAGNETHPGGAESTGEPRAEGREFQIEGTAEYGPLLWEYRWVFRFREGGGGKTVTGIYSDDHGGGGRYQGIYDEDESRVQMVAELPEGNTGRFQMTLLEPGLVLVEAVISDVDDNPVLSYSARNTAPDPE